MATGIKIITSMATRALIAELAEATVTSGGQLVSVEAAGGVNVARRVSDGESVDIVVLAAQAIDRLITAGHLRADSRIDLVRSEIAVAVPADKAHPDLSSESSVRAAVLQAAGIAYSTGPSGTYLTTLFDRWGIADELTGRLHQAPAGVPVAQLLAEGRATLGFQQLSELAGAPGIEVVGGLPAAIAYITVFTAGISSASGNVDAARGMIESWRSQAMIECIRRHGMQPA